MFYFYVLIDIKHTLITALREWARI